VSGPQHRRILGEAIRVHRKHAVLSQESLAEKADLTAKYLGEVERGYANISVDALVRIAKALRVRVNDLTKGF
jgi:transcriptional regulator with XRE-family HTH domain